MSPQDGALRLHCDRSPLYAAMEPSGNRSTTVFFRLGMVMLILTALYLGREILVPLALASLLAFMLSPLVGLLTRCRLPRSVSVVMVTVVIFSALAWVMWLLGREVHHLAGELPKHQTNIQQRAAALQQFGEGGVLSRLRSLVANVSTGSKEADVSSEPPPEPPQERGGSAGDALTRAVNFMVSTLAAALGTAGLVVLFVIFMLLRQEDLAQRVIRLVGYSRLTLTSKALDEVGDRVSRYLITQFTLNGAYGLVLAIGLAFVGLPYIVLWGVLAAMFRFIPYIGPWLVAVLPIGLSLAVFDGWTQPLLVLALVLTLELITNMILEPKFYGQSIGVSDFGILLAITFWTWMWGGIGLLLATPLTVCVVVFCRYIPSLEWVEIMMGEKCSPQPHLMLYQRLLAEDEDAALDVVRESAQDRSLAEALSDTALPALALARREAAVARLDSSEEKSIYRSMKTVMDLFDEQSESQPSKEATIEQKKTKPLALIGIALKSEADSLALEMLRLALPDSHTLDILSDQLLAGEWMERVESDRPSILIISAIPPGSHLAITVLCRRLRKRVPDTRILVGVWALPGQMPESKPLLDAGAAWVVSSLREAVHVIQSGLPSQALCKMPTGSSCTLQGNGDSSVIAIEGSNNSKR